MLGRNVQINFFIWMVDNPARADLSAPTDECIALGVARLVDNSQILPILLSQTV